MTGTLVREVKTVLSQAGITPDCKVVIGVSGGPDSLALLHILKEIMLQECLMVGHLNHRLRPEADGDAEFVAHTAESWNIPFRLEEVDVTELSKRCGMSVEEAARHARYAFLTELAMEIDANYIVVAHNADDQVETVFLNLLRGTGLSGLRGMEAVRRLPGQPQMILVRPFLFTSRMEIEEYCRDHSLRPVFDGSNRDLAFRRNYLRHELLPRLSSLNPQFRRHVQQLAELVKADEAFLEQQTKTAWNDILREQGPDWLHLDRLQWAALPLSLQRRTLRHGVRVLRSSAQDISFRTIDQAQQVAKEGRTGAVVTLTSNLTLQIAYDVLIMRAGVFHASFGLPQLLSDEMIQLQIPGSVTLVDGWHITSEISNQKLARIRQNRDPWHAYVDVGRIQQLQVGSREPGERFQPLGMDGRSVSLQDLMVNLKLPAHLRSRWPVIFVDDSPVWLVGHHVDERAKVTANTSRVVLLSCKRDNDL